MRGRQKLLLTGATLLVALASTATASPRSTVALRYIALGDSFSSGEGVPPFRPGTDQYLPLRDTCHRSFRGYPALIAGRRSSPGTWGFWACSGALTSDMTHANHGAPNARILVFGYPNPFPASAPPLSRCRVWLEPADIRFFHDEVNALNASIRYATAKVANANVRYLAPTGFAGHDACSNSPWFNGLDVVPTEFRYSFHPNLLGQRRLAKIALAAI
jgi:hypothetical protein